MSYILGISAFYHDSAAVLIKDGKILAAIQEERFTRKKNENSFPYNAIRECMKIAKINLNQVEKICYYEDPEIKFDRIMKTYKRKFPKGSYQLIKNFNRYRNYKNINKLLLKYFKQYFNHNNIDVYFSKHHLSHASASFFASKFKDSAILCIDGVGEWDTTTAWIGSENRIDKIWSIKFPHSIGLLYSSFTYYCGFEVDLGEYKLMGLAPYGNPIYKNIILENLISIQDNGQFKLNMNYFNYEVGNSMINRKFSNLFNEPPRDSEDEMTQFYMDIASSIQLVTEEIIVKMANDLYKTTNSEYLCLSGGVALNCVVNGILLKKTKFKDIFIQPAAGDAGAALGAALTYWHIEKKNKRDLSYIKQDLMEGGYLGTEYTNETIESELLRLNANFKKLSDNALIQETAANIEKGMVCGWFQGKMEFGPRALGNRSIIGDARNSKMQRIINLKIKNRESFRPFAPIVLENHAREWFDIDVKSPYMLFVTNVSDDKLIKSESNKYIGFDKLNQIRSTIPAVTHVNNSARIQTINEDYNPKMNKLIEIFYENTNVPLIINTSFNVKDEPIVESPKDAYKCFMETDMDCLVIGNYILLKTNNNS